MSCYKRKGHLVIKVRSHFHSCIDGLGHIIKNTLNLHALLRPQSKDMQNMKRRQTCNRKLVITSLWAEERNKKEDHIYGEKA